VREAAAWALRRIGDKRAVEPLIQALRDEDHDVRRAAAEALGRLGDPRAVEPLVLALKDKEIRWDAIEALGKLADPQAIEPLVPLLRDESSMVRTTAAEALEKLNWQHTQDENALWYWLAKGDVEKCIALGTIAVEPLISALKHKDDVVRSDAAYALFELGDSRTVEPFIHAQMDRFSLVRWRAANALKKITGKDFGDDPKKWRKWWEENKGRFIKRTQ
jgi:HEAT repeat protein